MVTRTGILALQGDVEPHRVSFSRCGAEAREVRAASDLDALTHLVIPGGESTTLAHLLELFSLWGPLVRRAREGTLALFGTCAGAILLGRAPDDECPALPRRLELVDVTLRRNAYGRQLDSHVRRLSFPALGTDLTGVFIRAPRIEAVGADACVLVRDDAGEPVAVEAPGRLLTTFHTELTADDTLHRYFLDHVRPTPDPLATEARP